MKGLIRLAVVGGASVVALVLAVPALAAFKPSIDVSVPNDLGASGVTTIHFAVSKDDDGTAAITAYAPNGFTANPGTPGSTIGTAEATVRAGALGGVALPITGTVVVRDGSGTYLSGGAQVPLAEAATGCTGTATHGAFWVAVLSAAGQTLEVPMYVDLAAGPETAFASAKLQLCLPPEATAPFGAKLFDAKLKLKNVFTNPTAAGLFVWVAAWTPYATSAGPANLAGTVETRSINGLPVKLTLKGTYDKKKKSARLAGQITAGGQFQAGVQLPLFSGTKKTGLKASGTTGKTTASGLFTTLRKILKPTFFQVRLAVPAVDRTAQGCAPAILPFPCVSAKIGPFAALSSIVRVAPTK